MFNFFQKSLGNKLLLAFFTIGFLPFITLLVYMIFLSETKIVERIVVEQMDKTKSVVKLVDSHLDSLRKEVVFLSSLDLMDDLIADDLDKRISRLLSKKSEDLGLDIKLTCVNVDGRVMASSFVSDISKEFNVSDLHANKGSFVVDKTLYAYSKIYASFERSKALGFLILEYNLDNLNFYLTHESNAHSYFLNRNSGESVGLNFSPTLACTKDEEVVINSEHVIVYKNLSSVLEEWFIVYAVDKSFALAFLHDFIRFTLYVALVIFLLIVLVAWRYSRDIVKPIEKLTYITDAITKTQDYTVELKVDSQDEIAVLAQSFNEMIRTTSWALQKLEKENKLRLQRFTQLIDIFNVIIQTKEEDECVKVSIKEIKKLTNRNDLYFIQDKQLNAKSEFTDLYVNDFEKDAKVYIGSISLGIESFEDEYEKNFYDSISSMVTLQIDKIRLIKRTMAASNAKSAFISSMSHELRTPLNSIIGSTQNMIAYDGLNDEQMDVVANIESSAQYLLEMINEILDVAKIEAGKMEVSTKSVDVLRLLQSSYDMLSPLAGDKGLEFEFEYEKSMDYLCKTDPKLFQQIVINLLSNAIKFTDKGRIVLKLFEDEENIFVSIKDSGSGINKEDIGKLFEEFIQLQSITQTANKGTGLGLSISKKMARLLNGDVVLKSQGVTHGTEALFFIKKEKTT